MNTPGEFDYPPIIPVIVIDDAENALPTAEALLEGGLDLMEITLRTDAALESMRRIAASLPEMRVGAGTIITGEQAKEALDAGALFGLAPGFSEAALRVFGEAGKPFIPGVATPTEITRALEHGLRRLKFFPAGPAGGPAFLKAANAPFRSSGVRYCPTGGINPGNMKNYLDMPEVFSVGGSWLATAKQIATGDIKTITKQVREALGEAANPES